MSGSWLTKLALGATLATSGALVMVLGSLLGWYANPRPWMLALAFAAGVVAGIGTTLGISGLIERARIAEWAPAAEAPGRRP
jgi:hypothetical protein